MEIDVELREINNMRIIMNLNNGGVVGSCLYENILVKLSEDNRLEIIDLFK